MLRPREGRAVSEPARSAFSVTPAAPNSSCPDADTVNGAGVTLAAYRSRIRSCVRNDPSRNACGEMIDSTSSPFDARYASSMNGSISDVSNRSAFAIAVASPDAGALTTRGTPLARPARSPAPSASAFIPSPAEVTSRSKSEPASNPDVSSSYAKPSGPIPHTHVPSRCDGRVRPLFTSKPTDMLAEPSIDAWTAAFPPPDFRSATRIRPSALLVVNSAVGYNAIPARAAAVANDPAAAFKSPLASSSAVTTREGAGKNPAVSTPTIKQQGLRADRASPRS